MEYSSATLDWGTKQAKGIYDKGQFLDWDSYWEHARSTGYSEEKAQMEFPPGYRPHVKVSRKNCLHRRHSFPVHGACTTPKEDHSPPSEQPMRGERALDIAINDLGYLRLLTDKPYVWHLGNVINAALVLPPPAKRKSLLQRLL